ncbi:hypothetical protein BH23CHL7_BH23CHL7_16940 [soil metagenome]
MSQPKFGPGDSVYREDDTEGHAFKRSAADDEDTEGHRQPR